MKDINEIIDNITKSKGILLPEGFAKSIKEAEFKSYGSDKTISVLELSLAFTNVVNDVSINELMKFYRNYFDEAFPVIVEKAKEHVKNNICKNFTITIGNEERRNIELSNTYSYIENILRGRNFQDIEIRKYLNDKEPESNLGEKHITLTVVYCLLHNSSNKNMFDLFIYGNNISYWKTDKDNPKLANKIKNLIILDKLP